MNWILVRRTFFSSFHSHFIFLFYLRQVSTVVKCVENLSFTFVSHSKIENVSTVVVSVHYNACLCLFRSFSLCSSSTVYVAWMVFSFLGLSSKCVGFLFGVFLVDTRVKCITLFTLKFCAIEISNAFSFGIVIYE